MIVVAAEKYCIVPEHRIMPTLRALLSGERYFLNARPDAAWLLCVLLFVSFFDQLRRSLGWNTEDAWGCGAMAIMFATAVWLPVRILPRLMRITDRHRREELAVTFVKSRPYLWQCLKWPIIFTPGLASMASLMLLMAGFHYCKHNSDFLVLSLMVLCLGLIVLAISMAGIFMLTQWLCASPRNGAWAWMAVMMIILMTVAAFMTAFMTGDAVDRYISNDIVSVSLTLPIFTASSVILARWRWQRCHSTYFVFDWHR